MPPAELQPPEPAPTARFRAWGRARADRVGEQFRARSESSPTINLSVELYERDRDAFASMFGSAIALRLFLFLVPAMLVVVGLIATVAGTDGLGRLVDASGATGSIAAQLSDAARSANSAGWWLLGIGLILTPWAGRGLITVLGACARGSWRLGGRKAHTSLRSMSAVIALLMLMVTVTFLLSQVRGPEGIAVSIAGLVAASVAIGAGWFAVSWALPRGTTDPGALLPGALLVGAGLGLLQWFMQFYLPDRLTRSSAVMGSLGVSIAILGYMFLVGRLLAASLIIDAVIFERFGSISGVVFALPGLRRLPAGSPWLARFFDLDTAAPLATPIELDPDPSTPAVADASETGKDTAAF